jgi:hypothetical protein
VDPLLPALSFLILRDMMQLRISDLSNLPSYVSTPYGPIGCQMMCLMI